MQRFANRTPAPETPLQSKFREIQQSAPDPLNSINALIKALKDANLTQDQSAAIAPALVHVQNTISQQSQLIAQLQEIMEVAIAQPTADEMERRRSLVLIGLPELAPPQDKDAPRIKASDQIREDEAAVTRILDELGVAARPTAIYRMGHPDPGHNPNRPRRGPRLLKIVMPSSTYQRTALGAFGRNRNQVKQLPNCSNVLLRPSLSPEERDRERELHAELKRRKKDQPHMTWMIKRNEIISVDKPRTNQVDFQ
ncbi:hypothetical protein DdX_16659 [Ditylenchus destructor]|uniref:Uncharacterized protein n=1 Tax=Ditylenchus destructor TaxID=166010 RepID=A0AAD4QZP3_9BILA|nr:hypothetical protein DdX_16659 [Ditylenchus destructor]